MTRILKAMAAVLLLACVAGGLSLVGRAVQNDAPQASRAAGSMGTHPATVGTSFGGKSPLHAHAVSAVAEMRNALPGKRRSRTEALRDIERRLLPGQALDADTVKELLASPAFDHTAREVGNTYATDPDAYRIKSLYAAQLQHHLASLPATLRTFECGLGYCLGEIRGPLAPGKEDGLAAAVDTGAFAVLPWLDDRGQAYRFVFSTDPSVNEIQGTFAGG